MTKQKIQLYIKLINQFFVKLVF